MAYSCPACREHISMIAQICPHCRTVLSSSYTPDEHAGSGGLGIDFTPLIHWAMWTVLICILVSAIIEFVFIADDVPFPVWLGGVDLVVAGILSFKYREKLPLL